MGYDQLLINSVYDQIIKHITDTIVFGIPVDISNIRSVAVAAYLLGKNEGMQASTAQKEEDFL
jgi:uncharacterized membrane protein YccF (DUF307 family)